MASPDRSLSSAVVTLLTPFGPAAMISHRSVEWASATFVGLRHEMRVAVEGAMDAAEQIGPLLAHAEIGLCGHILADMVLVDHVTNEGRLLLDIEALTLVES